MKPGPILPNALFITLLNVVARSAQLLLFLAIGNLYGANDTTDTILKLQAPLLVIVTVVAGVADVVVMPTLHRAAVYGLEHEVQKRLSGYVFVTVGGISLIALLVTFFIVSPKSVGPLFFLFPIPILAAQSAIYTGALNAQGRHRLAALGPLYGGSLAIIALLMLPASEISLASTLLAYELMRALGLRANLRSFINKAPEPCDPVQLKAIIIRALQNAKIQALGSFLVGLNPLIAITFASHLGESAVTLVEYANRLWNAVPLLFSGNIILFFSHASRNEAAKQGMLVAAHNAATRFGVIALIISMLFIVWRHQITFLLYGNGELDPTLQSQFAELLGCYFFGAGPFIASIVYTRIFSARGEPGVLVKAAAFSVAANCTFNWIFVSMLGLSGIGVASAITHLSVMILLALTLIRSPIARYENSSWH
ncbi:MAG: lipid II flippase MurJ [Gammaproteobacteria bacterium]